MWLLTDTQLQKQCDERGLEASGARAVGRSERHALNMQRDCAVIGSVSVSVSVSIESST